MSFRKCSALILVAVMIIALVAVGCGGEAGPSEGGRLVVGNNSDVASLDPHMATDLYTIRVCDQIFDTLVRLDFDGNYVGSLAESWSVSGDGTVWEFDLRDDVVYHDGESFDASDVIFTFERILDPELESPRRNELGLVEDMRVGDDGEADLIITLREPNGAFLSTLLTVYVVPEHLVGDLGDKPRGSGPFVLEEWVPEERIVLSAFDDYWGDRPLLDELVFRPIPEVSTRVVELETGGIHLMDEVPGEDLERLEALDEIRVTSAVGSNYSVMGLNTAREPFDDPNVRKAIAYAIDRERLVEVVYPGTAVAADGPLPPSSWAYDEDFSGPGYDLERALGFMENSSVPDGFSAELLISEGERMERGAVLIQSMLEEIGIEVEVVTQEWGTFLQSLIARDYDMLRVAWTTDPEPDALMYSLMHSSSEALNFTGLSSPDVDSLLDRARAESDVEERAALYREVQSIAVEEATMIYLLHENHVAASADSVHDFRPHLTGAFYFQNTLGAGTWMEVD